MSNLPLYGQLPIDPKKSTTKFQKLNAASAIKVFQKIIEAFFLFSKQPRSAQLTEIRSILKPSGKHYGAAIILDLLILILVVNLGFGPASKLVAPWIEGLQPKEQLDQSKIPHDLFAFAPGWSMNKLSKIKLDGLSTLAFFDIPVNRDGTLNLDNSGYETFKSEQASDLFGRASQKGVKVVVTLSQLENSEINQILNDPAAQQNVIAQSIEEVRAAGIDGVNISFEYKGTAPWGAKGKFNQFVKDFTSQMHTQIPGSMVTVSVPSAQGNDAFYDLRSLSASADKVLMIAYNFAVPETRNEAVISPIFGFGDGDYWSNLSQVINNFLYQLPLNKFQMETAWYGNGNSYPLYIPKGQPEVEGEATRIGNTLQTPLLDETTESLLSEVPNKSRQSARKNLPFIAKALEEEGILNENVLAYALATIEHETAGTFEPIDEIKGRKSARRLGYEGGTAFFGRGFIQLTHLRNYKVIGARIGMGDELVKNPELASKPDIAAKVLAAFFKDNNVANLAESGNFVSARNPVNPDSWAYQIARIARRYLYSIG